MKKRGFVVMAVVAAVCFAGSAAGTDLEITPVEDFEPSGYVGGPFTPSSKDYQLKNVGPSSLHWGADVTVAWLHLHPDDWGELDANESTIVTVSLTTEANSLGEGIYADTLTFTDITNGGEQTRDVTLTISTAAGVLEITPVTDFESSGEIGGPFTPASKDYQLTNVGGSELCWGVDKTVDWLDVGPEDWGELGPSESNIVTVSLNAIAEALGEGVHTDTLTFTDITNEEEQTRGVTLTVSPPEGIWVSPTSFDVNVIEGCTLTETLTIGNNGLDDLDFMIRTRVVGGTTASGEARAGDADAGKARTSLVREGRDFAAAGNAPYKRGELIVRFAARVNGQQRSLEDRNQILSFLGGGVVKEDFRIVPGLSVVKLPEGMTVEDALKAFNKASGILYAEPNYELKALSTFPNDPRFDELWGMHNMGRTGGTLDADIDAPEAWDIATGSSDIVVAVIDTGVDYTHVDLAANMWVNEDEYYGTPGVDDDGNGYVDDIYGYDFCNYDPDPMDDHYHGTHCAGTIGGVGNNGEGVAGVCWDVRIMALKFLDSGGGGWTDDAIKCVQYSTLMGANLSSNSWGGGGYSQGLKDAIDAAGAAGMLFVAAAGNDSSNNDTHPHYPSSYDCESLIAVMSTNDDDNKSGFSNYGPVSVDLGAPGSDILSCEPGNRYQYLDGTSMATPHVAGACALLWSMNPMLANSEIKNILLQTVDPTLSGLCVSEGRLNLYNAILETRAPWIRIEPEEGTIGSGDSNEVSVTFDAVELAPGTYEAEVVVISNDPCNPIKTVPVTMTVNPDDLQMTPAEGFESSGTKGGPFEPRCTTYTLTNNGSAPVNWATFEVEGWLEVDPNWGVLDPNESVDVNVCISAYANLLEPNLYSHTLTFQNTDSNSIKPRLVTLTVKPPDCFTESFDEGGADLAGLMLTFSPDGSVAYYEACREKVSEFPTDPNGGTYISLGDDDFEEVALGAGKEILFYGQWYDRFYVGSNGYITFGQGDTEYADTLENQFSMPRVSALFTDLAPADTQSISFRQLEDRVAVTFEDVPLYGDKTTKNSFQIEMFFVDGTMCVSWLEVAATTSVAGLSEGKGLPPVFFVESDLSAYPPCWPLGDLDRNYLLNFADFAVLAAYWQDKDCSIPYWCGRSDLDFSGATDMNDVAIFVDGWLIEEAWWLQPIGHWKFDEGEGDIAYDSAGNNHGTVYGAQWTTGQIGGALDFDGIDDYVGLPDNDPVWLPQYNFTLSVWAYFERDPAAAVEYILDLNHGESSDPSNELGYGLNRTGSTGVLAFRMTTTTNTDEDLVTDDVLAKNKWYHLVAVRDGTTQAIYIDGEPNVSRTCSPDPIDFVGGYDDDKVNIGKFSRAGVSSAFELKGIIDDVRIYNRALSGEEVEQLYEERLGGRAFNPHPPDGAVDVDPNVVLSWTPGKDAISHDVYFGTDFNDVSDANTASDAFMGNQGTTSWDPNNYDSNGLELETTYYWRIDEVGGSDACKGDAWSFTTWASEPEPNLLGWWKFDEGQGTTAYDSAGDNHGTIYGAQWTGGQIGGALDFDGIDDYVGLPDNDPVWLPQNDFTLSVWVYFERDAGSPIEQILDLNLANSSDPSNELGYGLNRSQILGGALVFHMTTTTDTNDDLWTEEILYKNKWYHIVAVRDGTTQAIYIDGEPNVSRTCSPDPIDFVGGYDDDKVNIGKFSRAGVSSAFELKGIIDDVRIYDRALTAEEIQQLYQE